MKKSVIWGLVLILVGVYLVVSRIGLIPDLPFFTVVFTILFVYTAVQGLFMKSFTMMLTSVALLGWIYQDYLKIDIIAPWPLIPAALLVGIGLDLIFKNVFRKKNKKQKNIHYAAGHHGNVQGPYIENIPDGEFVNVANTFGAISKYVNSGVFREAKIKNSFGSCNVYFNNAIMKENQAVIKVENSFGEINLYFPATWRISTKQSASFGDIQFHGMASTNPESPCVYIDAESCFGSINVYSE